MSNEHVHPFFAGLLNDLAGEKKHLQGQRVKPRPATNRDRFDALSYVHAELEAAGVSMDISQLDWAVKEVEQRLHEASLDRQFAEEQRRQAGAHFLEMKCWECGHARGEHDEKDCRGGEDILCRCDSFVEPDEDAEAEREERRQYREWRNDSGV